MDIFCPKCGEPWDFDSLHDEASERSRAANPPEPYAATFSKVRIDFTTNGCSALRAYEARCSNTPNELRSAVAEAAFIVCGDDIDGVASMCEDFGL